MSFSGTGSSRICEVKGQENKKKRNIPNIKPTNPEKPKKKHKYHMPYVTPHKYTGISSHSFITCNIHYITMP
jgi:hypothetical protein